MTILFVCTGNTCRSPLALAAWRALQARGEVPRDWSAFSSGLAPHIGQRPSPFALDIARGWGVDLSSHRARGLDAGALRQIDRCVGITGEHARTLRKMLRHIERAPQVLCLSDFVPLSPSEQALRKMLGAGQEREIADPFGGSREAYEACATLIEPAVARLALHIQQEQAGGSSTCGRAGEEGAAD